MADSTALIQALATRQRDLEQENPWLNTYGSVAKANTMNPLNPWGSLAAALGQGLVGGIMKGYGQDQVNTQLAQDRSQLYDIAGGGLNPKGTVWSDRYQPHLDAITFSQIERQQEQAQKEQDRERALNDALYKIKVGKDYGTALIPEAEKAKYEAKLQYEPQLQSTLAEQEKLRELGSPEFVYKQEDAAYKRLISTDAGEAMLQLKPRLEQIRRTIGVDDRSADLQVVQAMAKLIDPNAVIRGEDIKFQSNIDPYVRYLYRTMKSELDNGPTISTESKIKLFRMATDLYSTQRSMYEQLAKREAEIAKERTGGRASERSVMPVPLSTGRTGWATDKRTGQRVYFDNGEIIFQGE